MSMDHLVVALQPFFFSLCSQRTIFANLLQVGKYLASFRLQHFVDICRIFIFFIRDDMKVQIIRRHFLLIYLYITYIYFCVIRVFEYRISVEMKTMEDEKSIKTAKRLLRFWRRIKIAPEYRHNNPCQFKYYSRRYIFNENGNMN